MHVRRISIENFRTIERLDIKLEDKYTAISGQNDAGKSNITKAIKLLFDYEDDLPFYFQNDDFSFSQDYPKWKAQSKDKEDIKISVEILIDEDLDAGLYKFVERQLLISQDQKFEIITASLRCSHEQSAPSVSIIVNDKIYEGLPATEVIKKIKNTKAIFFHNSTQVGSQFGTRHGVSRLTDVADEAKEILNKFSTDINKKVQKISRASQQSIEQLLGKLGAKYKVSIAVPDLELGWVPFKLNLSDNKCDVPLSEWGSGTQNRTMILLALLRAKHVANSAVSTNKVTPVIFLEEPESFLHPSAQAEFGRVLQDLAEEFGVQVVATTHSPYLLNLRKPNSNILVERRMLRGQPQESVLADIKGDQWVKPFSQALGLASSELTPWRDIFAKVEKKTIFVEGAVDKEYFEFIKSKKLESCPIPEDVEIFSYDGCDHIRNGGLLRFIVNSLPRAVFTFDLDSATKVEPALKGIGLQANVHYFKIGLDKAGHRRIEGLVPQRVQAEVYAKNPQLVAGLQSDILAERKSASSNLKQAILREFKKSKDVEDFSGFSPLLKKIARSLSRT